MNDPVFDIFREEAREHLGALEKGFLDLEAAPVDSRRPVIDTLFRHAHSLKGDAKAIGVTPLRQSAQVLEDRLDEMRSAPEAVNADAINQGLTQLDLVRTAFDDWLRSVDTEEGSEPDLAPPETQEEIQQVSVAPSVQVLANRTEPPVPQDQERSRSPTPQPAPVTSPAPSSAVGAREENFTVRVPSERLDRMLNLAGEIRISQRVAVNIQDRLEVLNDTLAQLPIASRSLNRDELPELRAIRHQIQNWQTQLCDQVRHLERQLHKKSVKEEMLVESLEADIRQARLLPLTMLADSLRRVVRDLAQSLGKQIRYDFDVGKILMDKAVIEALREPLVHLIRNAADHGLETAEERSSTGKPTEGRIRLDASRTGELVEIRISDDGRGINYEKIRSRLLQDDELEEGDIAELSQHELTKYLFQPGFSTTSAGEVSGRGVGLDVVRTEVQRLNGTLELFDGDATISRRGQASTPSGSPTTGTTFVISVPVTISTVRILTILSGGQYYGIPTSSILRTGSVSEDQLDELEGSLVLSTDEGAVRWVPLSELLGLPESPQFSLRKSRPYLMVNQAGRKVAIAVDDLEDESEVLLKPLGFPFNGLSGIIGGTVRPDGSVQAVLDVANIAFANPVRRSTSPRKQPQVSGRILVVDDSPTTRTMLRNVFTAAGYMVRTASDGVDALERLRSQLVDLVVSDVEMPRMNGLDLTRQIKSKIGIPVILVTGKEKEEHRREGLEAGADAYVVKSSFEGDGLLDVIKQFV